MSAILLYTIFISYLDNKYSRWVGTGGAKIEKLVDSETLRQSWHFSVIKIFDTNANVKF